MTEPNQFRRFWLAWSITAAVFILFGLLVAWKGLPADLNGIGDAIAGPAAFLAFVWLVVTIRLQYTELVEQRKISSDMYETTRRQTELMQKSTEATLTQLSAELNALQWELQHFDRQAQVHHMNAQDKSADRFLNQVIHVMIPTLCESPAFDVRRDAKRDLIEQTKLRIQGRELGQAFVSLGEFFRQSMLPDGPAETAEAIKERVIDELQTSRYIGDVIDVCLVNSLKCEQTISMATPEAFRPELKFGVQYLKNELMWLFEDRARFPNAFDLFKDDIAALKGQLEELRTAAIQPSNEKAERLRQSENGEGPE